MNKKLFSRVLIIIVLLVVTAFFYFIFKNTKKIKIKNEPQYHSAEAEATGQVENDLDETNEDSAERVGQNDENIKENEIIETPTITENKTEQNKGEEIIENSASSPNITGKLISWGYQSANSRSIDTIVIHSSYDALGDDPYDLDGLIDEYKQYGVAAHYLIDRKGKIYQLVKDKNIAYHAGVGSVPDGRTDVNNFSVGIELMNTKDDKFTDAQYSSLNELVDYLKSQHKIKYTLGHNQIAPGRKDDPWNFNWDSLRSTN